MAPAIPAAFLLVLSIPFLIPIAGRRLAAFGDLATWPVTRRSRRVVVGICAFLAIAPDRPDPRLQPAGRRLHRGLLHGLAVHAGEHVPAARERPRLVGHAELAVAERRRLPGQIHARPRSAAIRSSAPGPRTAPRSCATRSSRRHRRDPQDRRSRTPHLRGAGSTASQVISSVPPISSDMILLSRAGDGDRPR